MFTWICPQCGREVPPSYNECPDCAAKQKGQTAAAPSPPGAQFAGPPPPPGGPSAPPAPSTGVRLPAWLLSIVFALAFLALGALAYFGLRHFGGTSQATSPPVTLEKPASAGLGKPSTLQKYIEVVGLRLTEEPKQKPQARFVVVNHSGAEIADLAANVNLWARTAKSDEEAVGTFSFKLSSLGPWESKELTAVLNTKLRVYELPDWQNLTAEIQVTSPR